MQVLEMRGGPYSNSNGRTIENDVKPEDPKYDPKKKQWYTSWPPNVSETPVTDKPKVMIHMTANLIDLATKRLRSGGCRISLDIVRGGHLMLGAS